MTTQPRGAATCRDDSAARSCHIQRHRTRKALLPHAEMAQVHETLSQAHTRVMTAPTAVPDQHLQNEMLPHAERMQVHETRSNPHTRTATVQTALRCTNAREIMFSTHALLNMFISPSLSKPQRRYPGKRRDAGRWRKRSLCSPRHWGVGSQLH